MEHWWLLNVYKELEFIVFTRQFYIQLFTPLDHPHGYQIA